MDLDYIFSDEDFYEVRDLVLKLSKMFDNVRCLLVMHSLAIYLNKFIEVLSEDEDVDPSELRALFLKMLSTLANYGEATRKDK